MNKYKIAFITESKFKSKVPRNYENNRVENAWISILNADHYPIDLYNVVSDYDFVFIIFPKGHYIRSLDGKVLYQNDTMNNLKKILDNDIVSYLKNYNKKVFYVQEGPCNLFEDYDVEVQFKLIESISKCDALFVHNKYDVKYYSGIFSNQIFTIPSVMIEDRLLEIEKIVTNKVMINGNFSSWYGGLRSFIISQYFDDCQIYNYDSHAKRQGEENIEGLNLLKRMNWLDWMKEISHYKYAINMMPTVAAGTFSLNMAYFKIPTIGNIEIDTQYKLFPELSIQCNDIKKATELAVELNKNKSYYNKCSNECYNNYKNSVFYEPNWIKYMNEIFSKMT